VNDGAGFELSGWTEYKLRIDRDLERIDRTQKELGAAIGDVRELVGRKIETFRAEELQRLRVEQQREFEKAEGAATSLERRLAELDAKTGAALSALQVKASVWGALAGAVPAAIAILWSLLKK